jgi:hypothetical protein
MNPWLLLAAGTLWAGSLASTGWWMYERGKDSELATQAREDKAVAIASGAAASAAAGAISKLGVKHVTIRQRTDTVVREVPVYRECRHDQRVLDDINEARTGRRAEPAGAGQLPAASAPGR